jgi:methylthioribulose-1-phosphate dehydratase
MGIGLTSLQALSESLCATARWCYGRGWAPATSGNFSVRAGSRIFITPSGLDKGTVTPAHLLEVDQEGRSIAGTGKPSAETGLHLVIYHARPQAGAILHVHTIWNTLLSGHFAAQGYLAMEGYEILKGLSGVMTHAHLERVPILENSQDYAELSQNLSDALDEFPQAHGVLLSRHGLYTWGQSVIEARRHLEALEFLFEVEGRRVLNHDPVLPDILT